jgi:mannan endo-1,4-beta-mannosidase
LLSKIVTASFKIKKVAHMQIIRLSVLALFTGLCFPVITLSIEPVNPNLNPTAIKVLEYLESIYQKKTLCGYNVYVHTPDDYEQTGMQAATWGRDIRWLGDPAEIVAHAKRNRYILTLHWHWFFDEDSAWSGKRKNKVNVGRTVTPGTQEYNQAIIEMAAAADKLQILEDSDIPVLWRPLHEIDGGWFWWTDKETPENTARLWRMMYEYLTYTRKLDNLIWVYSAGVGNKTAEYRSRFYPGNEYVDISGIDIYGLDFQYEVDKYWEYYNIMSKVSPGKMLACGECDAIPDPDKMQSGDLPKWLYALPWWGTPSNRRPADWAVFTMRHDFVITLDEIPAFGADNIAPHVGILNPLDDGSAWYIDKPCVIETNAIDRDGTVLQVRFYADGQLIGTDNTPPYTFTWLSPSRGFHNIKAEAVDDKAEKTASNTVRVCVGLVDLAKGKPAIASSGKSPENAVDGNYYTTWSSEKSDDEWIYVDLGKVREINQVNLLWGWKIHARDYSIDVATAEPEKAKSWKTIHSQTGCAYQAWKATYRIRFTSTPARYVRMHASKRAGGQTWGGYQLAAFEVPISSDTAGIGTSRITE